MTGHLILFYMLVAAVPASQRPRQTVPELRAVMAPFLSCAQQFDPERVDVEARLQEAYELAERGTEKQRLDFNWELTRQARELGARKYQIYTKIDEVCRREDAERKLQFELSKLAPSSPPPPAGAMRRQLFDTLLQLDRDLAAYKAGSSMCPRPLPHRLPRNHSNVAV